MRKVSRASGDLANVPGDGEAESGSGAENRRRSLFSAASKHRSRSCYSSSYAPIGKRIRANALKTRSYISPTSLPVDGAAPIDRNVARVSETS